MDNVKKTSKLTPEKVIGFKSKPTDFKITRDHAIVYALGIGFNEDPYNRAEFKYTYELDDKFTTFPSISNSFKIQETINILPLIEGLPDFNPMGVLHGEEWSDYYGNLPIDEPLYYQAEVLDVADRGKGTVLCVETKIYQKEGNKLLSATRMNTFIRGLKGEGVKPKSFLNKNLPKIPTSEPIKELKATTRPNQALLFRIGGTDNNPLHVDPDFAQGGGFEKPIIHGMCTYGIVLRKTVEAFCGGDETKVSSYNSRFTSHLFPGETILIKYWKNGSSSLIVVAYCVERKTQIMQGEVVIKGANF